MDSKRALFSAVLFGLLPPVFCGALVIAAYLPPVFDVGPFLESFTFITAGAALVGSPPMAASGYFLAKLADTGIPPSLRLTFAIGCAASLVAALVWSLVGWLSFNLLVYLAIGFLGGLATAILAALLFRRRRGLAV